MIEDKTSIRLFNLYDVISSDNKRSKKIRCEVCGRFIGYNEMPENVKIDFTPDTEFTIEETLFTHNHCL